MPQRCPPLLLGGERDPPYTCRERRAGNVAAAALLHQTRCHLRPTTLMAPSRTRRVSRSGSLQDVCGPQMWPQAWPTGVNDRDTTGKQDGFRAVVATLV